MDQEEKFTESRKRSSKHENDKYLHRQIVEGENDRRRKKRRRRGSLHNLAAVGSQEVGRLERKYVPTPMSSRDVCGYSLAVLTRLFLPTSMAYEGGILGSHARRSLELRKHMKLFSHDSLL